MTISATQCGWFDDVATLAMGEAFDRACVSLGRMGNAGAVRELIAKRIIAAAKTGERDSARLCQQALVPFGIEDMSTPFLTAGRVLPFLPMLQSRTRRDQRELG